MTNNDELERQAFEKFFNDRYVAMPGWDENPALLRRNIKYAAWNGWQARAKQESNMSKITPPKRSSTVTITRKQFRGVCDALAHTVNSRQALLAVVTNDEQFSEHALYAAQEKLQLVERLLRESIK